MLSVEENKVKRMSTDKEKMFQNLIIPEQIGTCHRGKVHSFNIEKHPAKTMYELTSSQIR